MFKITPLRAVAVGAAVLVVAFTVRHFVDRQRAADVTRLEGAIQRDSSSRVAQVAKTDTAIAGVEHSAAAIAHADSGWSQATAAAGRVPQILAQPVHDTVKIRELVYVVDTLQQRGDSLERVAIADTVTAANLREQLLQERGASQTEIDDQAKALQVSQAQARHWGLGMTIGPTLSADINGTVHVAPIGVSVGITYRW